MARTSDASKLVTLFATTLAVSVTANSGYAIIAAMRDSFVRQRGWFGEDEMNDYVAIAQTAPGPMAASLSVAVGFQVAGLAGALAAVAGVIIPPFASMALVTLFYDAIVGSPLVALFMRGMQLGAVGMLLDVCLGLFRGVTKAPKAGLLYPCALIALSFAYMRLTDCSVLWLAVACAAAGAARALLAAKGGGGA